MGKKKDKKNEILGEAEAAKKLAKKRKKKAKKAKKVRVAQRINDDDDDDGVSGPSKREKIGDLLDHPLVADVVAAGAVAAVAALAENRATTARGVKSGSRDMLKLAGTAAAAAIGKRIKAELDAAKAEREARGEGDED